MVCYTTETQMLNHMGRHMFSLMNYLCFLKEINSVSLHYIKDVNASCTALGRISLHGFLFPDVAFSFYIILVIYYLLLKPFSLNTSSLLYCG